MAKRAVRSSTRAVNSVKTDALPEGPGTRANGQPTDEEVRVRAYHRYLERGATDGADFHDWVEAEKELRVERQS
jgi:hypothetical protein